MTDRIDLNQEVKETSRVICSLNTESTDAFDILEKRLDSLRYAIEAVQSSGELGTDDVPMRQAWFKDEAKGWLRTSYLMNRATNWPEGYPGDFKTLESVYSRQITSTGLGALLDRYFLTRTLAVAVRSRRSTLASILHRHALRENGSGTWLNIACGACRELDFLPPEIAPCIVHCVDSDPNALEFSDARLRENKLNIAIHAENAFRYLNPIRNRARLGHVSLIYSAGLFDYIDNDNLTKLLRGLYDTLCSGGVLLAPFKDKVRYRTFDYHWLVNWNQFYQRTESQFKEILLHAGIPERETVLTRDPTGVLIFFEVTKS